MVSRIIRTNITISVTVEASHRFFGEEGQRTFQDYVRVRMSASAVLFRPIDTIQAFSRVSPSHGDRCSECKKKDNRIEESVSLEHEHQMTTCGEYEREYV